MRPPELDYSRKISHYFDIENGEVLAGQRERDAYIRDGGNPESIRDLGLLIRDPSEIAERQYEPLDTSEWTPEQYIQYGRWIRKIIAPPKPGGKWLTREILINAGQLGVGPSEYRIGREFGRAGIFFANLKLSSEDVSARNIHADLAIEGCVKYLQRVNRGKPPTRKQVDEIANRDSSRLSVRQMEQRYPNVKFGGLLRLAGFMGGAAVIMAWQREDFIEWGVKFMEDNAGELPGALALDYLAKQQMGPSSFGVRKRFDSIPGFEKEVAVAYWEKRAEQQQAFSQKLASLEERLLDESIPSTLLIEEGTKDQALELVNNLQRVVDDPNMVPEIQQVVSRFAKYSLIELMAPQIETKTKVKLAASGLTGRQFVTALCRHHDVPRNEIEYVALLNDIFDDIWLLNDNLPSLKLGDDFSTYVERRTERNSQLRRARQKQLVQAA